MVPIFKQWWAEPTDSQSHTASEEHRAKRRAPINKACLIQPQRSSLPSSLCLRKDTTAVTQTGVYPWLRAAVRAIIHRLVCQKKPREENSKAGTKVWKRKEKEENRTIKCEFPDCTNKCWVPLQTSPSCNMKFSVLHAADLRSDAISELFNMVLIIVGLSQHTAAVDMQGNWACKGCRNEQRERAKCHKFHIDKWNQSVCAIILLHRLSKTDF